MNGIQKCLAVGGSPYLETLERQLRMKLHVILEQERMFLWQKFRLQWLKHGEGCTKFFHRSIKIRRRLGSLVPYHNWRMMMVSGSLILKNWRTWQSLYRKESCPPVDTSQWQFPSLNHFDRSWLNRDVTYRIGPDKASGPDGFPPSFFSKTLNISGRLL